MSKPIEGESAFPHGPLEVYDEARQRWNSVDASRGLSERRYYIGQALMGICANPESLKEDFIHYPGEMAIAQVDHLMSLLYPQTEKETNQ